MTPKELESALSKLGNDAERYAYLMNLELQIKRKKEELRSNVLENFSKSPILVCGIQKNFRIDPTHELGKKLSSLKAQIKEIEEKAKEQGAGTFTETPFIRFKPPSNPNPNPKPNPSPTSTSSSKDYSGFFF